MKETFIIRTEWGQTIDNLSDQEAGELFKVILNYHKGIEPNKTQTSQSVFLLFWVFKSEFDRNIDRYNKIVERNRANGKKGGRKPKTNNQKTQSVNLGSQKNPKNLDHDHDNNIITNINITNNIEMPFKSIEFLKSWNDWKDYKKKEFNFKYKSLVSEKAQLSKLKELSGDKEEIAIKILNQSIVNGWKGFFPIKTNGKENKLTDQQRNFLINNSNI